MDNEFHDFPTSISALASFLDRDRALTLVGVRDLWNDIAGSNLAVHSWPSKIVGDELTIVVDSSLALNAIKLASRGIVNSLQSKGFGISNLKPVLRMNFSKNILRQSEGEYLDQ